MRADYVWEEAYKAALLETDEGRLRERLQVARAAIETRLQEMQIDVRSTPEELQAVTDAMRALRTLFKELQTRTQEGSSRA